MKIAYRIRFISKLSFISSFFFGGLLIVFVLFSESLSIAQDSIKLEASAQVYRYLVRGVIVKLPDAEKNKSELVIKHEDIPDYVDETGTKVGMHSMSMPFTLATSVSLAGFAVGDKIEFVFESWWKPKPGDRIVEIRKI
jgi:Cu/Ag efflux protein CusF